MRQDSIWSRLPVQEIPPTTSHRPFRWVVNATVPLALIVVAGIAVMLPVSLDTPQRIAIFIFSVAVIFWAGTPFNGAYVALATVISLVLSGVTKQDIFFTALASDVVWLMIGAFMLSGAVMQTGLAARMTAFVVNRATNVRSVFWLLTTVLMPLALVVPSTSGRAAIAIPIFHSIAEAVNDRRVTRALAILIPTIILVSTISTLIAAGSHLVAVDLLDRIAGVRISYFKWLLYGLPFGVASSYIANWVIMVLFLDKERLQLALPAPRHTAVNLSSKEKKTLGIVLLMVVLWLTEHWHGLEIATVTVVGALLLTLPGAGVLKWKTALNAVSWNLIIFVGAAIVMGKTLIDTGAGQWIIEHLLSVGRLLSGDDTFSLLLVISLIGLTSHIYITSHTARAVALVPALLFLAGSQDLNPAAVLFIGTLSMDYCQTFPVSSKALLMFYELETKTYRPADLLRLSAVLLIVHLLLIIAFYYGYWHWVGLAL